MDNNAEGFIKRFFKRFFILIFLFFISYCRGLRKSLFDGKSSITVSEIQFFLSITFLSFIISFISPHILFCLAGSLKVIHLTLHLVLNYNLVTGSKVINFMYYKFFLYSTFSVLEFEMLRDLPNATIFILRIVFDFIYLFTKSLIPYSWILSFSLEIFSILYSFRYWKYYLIIFLSFGCLVYFVDVDFFFVTAFLNFFLFITGSLFFVLLSIFLYRLYKTEELISSDIQEISYQIIRSLFEIKEQYPVMALIKRAGASLLLFPQLVRLILIREAFPKRLVIITLGRFLILRLIFFVFSLITAYFNSFFI